MNGRRLLLNCPRLFVQKAVRDFLGEELEPLVDSFLVGLFRDVAGRCRAFAVRHTGFGTFWYRAPCDLPTFQCTAMDVGAPPVLLDPAEIPDALARDLTDLADLVELAYHQVRYEHRTAVMYDADWAEAADRSAAFWARAKQEFIAKTWEPRRHVDWCLALDEKPA
jgi:hypothetical protein